MEAEPTVHIVDDDAPTRELIAELVKVISLKAASYRSAEEFLEAYKPAGPACLVVDAILPGMSGLELQRDLAAAGMTLPVIMITAYGHVRTAVEAMKAGAVDFFQKPFGAEEMIRSIRKAIKADDSTFLPQRDRRRIRALFAKAIGDIRTRGNVNPIITKDGSLRDIEWYDKTLKDARGNVVGLVCIGQDVTERNRAQQEAARAVREWQTTFDATSDAMWILDKDHRVLRSNKTAERLFHRPSGQLIGKPCCEIVHGTAQPIPECPLLRARESLARETVELPTGERWFEVVVDPILDEAGEWAGAVHIVSDITERKRVEEDLRKAKETAEAADRAKSEFWANMSHEIRTPMTAIMGFADVLISSDPPPAERRKHLQTIRRNGEHLLAIINGILDLSKIEAEKLELEPTYCSPRQVVEDVLSLMSLRAKEKHLSLSAEYVDPLPRLIRTDLGRLRQILVNLVGNAIKFTESGGVRVTLRCARGNDAPTRMQFEVADTGVGMTAKEMEGLFQRTSPCSQRRSTRSGEPPGCMVSSGSRMQPFESKNRRKPALISNSSGRTHSSYWTYARGPNHDLDAANRDLEPFVDSCDGHLSHLPGHSLGRRVKSRLRPSEVG